MVTEPLQMTQLVKIMCKTALAAILDFGKQRFKVKKMLYHQNDIECDFIDPQNTRHHLLSTTLSQIIEKVYQLLMAAILDFRSLGYMLKALHRYARSKLYTDIQYEMSLLLQTPETVYKEAQSTQLVKILFKKPMHGGHV